MLDAYGRTMKDSVQHRHSRRLALAATLHWIVCPICRVKFDVLDEELARLHSSEEHLLQSLRAAEKSAEARHLQAYAAEFISRLDHSAAT